MSSKPTEIETSHSSNIPAKMGIKKEQPKFSSRVPVKAPLTEINKFLMCELCSGYLVDATAIIECQHTFCKSCILQYLESNDYCPVCDVQMNKAKPHLSLRSDTILQKMVYKLVPGLFVSEVRRRWEHAKKKLQAEGKKPVASAAAALNSNCQDVSAILEETEDLCVLSMEDSVSLSLEYFKGSTKEEENNNSSKANDRRYLQCPAAVSVGLLKKFIRQKYGLSEDYKVDLLYNGDRDKDLEEDLTLLDLAFMFNWKKSEPMRFYYRIYDRVPKGPAVHPGTKRPFRSMMDEPPPDDDGASGHRDNSLKSSGTPSKLPRISSSENSSSTTRTNTSSGGSAGNNKKSTRPSQRESDNDSDVMEIIDEEDDENGVSPRPTRKAKKSKKSRDRSRSKEKLTLKLTNGKYGVKQTRSSYNNNKNPIVHVESVKITLPKLGKKANRKSMSSSGDEVSSTNGEESSPCSSPTRTGGNCSSSSREGVEPLKIKLHKHHKHHKHKHHKHKKDKTKDRESKHSSSSKSSSNESNKISPSNTTTTKAMEKPEKSLEAKEVPAKAAAPKPPHHSNVVHSGLKTMVGTLKSVQEGASARTSPVVLSRDAVPSDTTNATAPKSVPESVQCQVPKSVTLIPVNPNAPAQASKIASGRPSFDKTAPSTKPMQTFTHPITNKSLHQITVTEVPPPATAVPTAPTPKTTTSTANAFDKALSPSKQFNGPGSMEITKIYCDKTGSTNKQFDNMSKKLKDRKCLDITISPSPGPAATTTTTAANASSIKSKNPILERTLTQQLKKDKSMTVSAIQQIQQPSARPNNVKGETATKQRKSSISIEPAKAGIPSFPEVHHQPHHHQQQSQQHHQRNKLANLDSSIAIFEVNSKGQAVSKAPVDKGLLVTPVTKPGIKQQPHQQPKPLGKRPFEAVNSSQVNKLKQALQKQQKHTPPSGSGPQQKRDKVEIPLDLSGKSGRSPNGSPSPPHHHQPQQHQLLSPHLPTTKSIPKAPSPLHRRPNSANTPTNKLQQGPQQPKISPPSAAPLRHSPPVAGILSMAQSLQKHHQQQSQLRPTKIHSPVGHQSHNPQQKPHHQQLPSPNSNHHLQLALNARSPPAAPQQVSPPSGPQLSPALRNALLADAAAFSKLPPSALPFGLTPQHLAAAAAAGMFPPGAAAAAAAASASALSPPLNPLLGGFRHGGAPSGSLPHHHAAGLGLPGWPLNALRHSLAESLGKSAGLGSLSAPFGNLYSNLAAAAASQQNLVGQQQQQQQQAASRLQNNVTSSSSAKIPSPNSTSVSKQGAKPVNSSIQSKSNAGPAAPPAPTTLLKSSSLTGSSSPSAIGSSSTATLAASAASRSSKPNGMTGSISSIADSLLERSAAAANKTGKLLSSKDLPKAASSNFNISNFLPSAATVFAAANGKNDEAKITSNNLAKMFTNMQPLMRPQSPPSLHGDLLKSLNVSSPPCTNFTFTLTPPTTTSTFSRAGSTSSSSSMKPIDNDFTKDKRSVPQQQQQLGVNRAVRHIPNPSMLFNRVQQSDAVKPPAETKADKEPKAAPLQQQDNKVKEQEARDKSMEPKSPTVSIISDKPEEKIVEQKDDQSQNETVVSEVEAKTQEVSNENTENTQERLKSIDEIKIEVTDEMLAEQEKAAAAREASPGPEVAIVVAQVVAEEPEKVAVMADPEKVEEETERVSEPAAQTAEVFDQAEVEDAQSKVMDELEVESENMEQEEAVAEAEPVVEQLQSEVTEPEVQQLEASEPEAVDKSEVVEATTVEETTETQSAAAASAPTEPTEIQKTYSEEVLEEVPEPPEVLETEPESIQLEIDNAEAEIAEELEEIEFSNSEPQHSPPALMESETVEEEEAPAEINFEADSTEDSESTEPALAIALDEVSRASSNADSNDQMIPVYNENSDDLIIDTKEGDLLDPSGASTSSSMVDHEINSIELNSDNANPSPIVIQTSNDGEANRSFGSSEGHTQPMQPTLSFSGLSRSIPEASEPAQEKPSEQTTIEHSSEPELSSASSSEIPTLNEDLLLAESSSREVEPAVAQVVVPEEAVVPESDYISESEPPLLLETNNISDEIQEEPMEIEEESQEEEAATGFIQAQDEKSLEPQDQQDPLAASPLAEHEEGGDEKIDMPLAVLEASSSSLPHAAVTEAATTSDSIPAPNEQAQSPPDALSEIEPIIEEQADNNGEQGETPELPAKDEILSEPETLVSDDDEQPPAETIAEPSNDNNQTSISMEIDSSEILQLPADQVQANDTMETYQNFEQMDVVMPNMDAETNPTPQELAAVPASSVEETLLLSSEPLETSTLVLDEDLTDSQILLVTSSEATPDEHIVVQVAASLMEPGASPPTSTAVVMTDANLEEDDEIIEQSAPSAEPTAEDGENPASTSSAQEPTSPVEPSSAGVQVVQVKKMDNLEKVTAGFLATAATTINNNNNNNNNSFPAANVVPVAVSCDIPTSTPTTTAATTTV